jgi:uncharacterized protein
MFHGNVLRLGQVNLRCCILARHSLGDISRDVVPYLILAFFVLVYRDMYEASRFGCIDQQEINAMTRVKRRRNVRVFCGIAAFLTSLVAWAIYRQNSVDTELISAAKRLDGPAVKRCLAQGASPSATDSDTADPSWFRALTRTTGQAQSSYDGDTALLAALNRCTERINTDPQMQSAGVRERVEFEATEIVRALLAKGANANVHLRDGETAVASAQGCGYKKCVRLLLDHGAPANGTAENGRTLLVYAIQADDFDTVNELLRHGAKLNATGAGGVVITAYAVAMTSAITNESEHQRIIDLLRKYGARR